MRRACLTWLLPLLAGLCGCGERVSSGAAAAEGAPPARVLPTTTGAADLVLALIAPERVVGVPKPYLEFAVEEGAKWPEDRVFTQFTAEVLLAWDPDLVVTGSWQSQDTISWLERSGVKVLRLPTIKSLDDIRASIRSLGAALSAEERAADLLQEIERRNQALRESSGPRRTLTALAYTNFGSGGWAAGKATTADLMIRLTGLQNAAGGDRQEGHASINIEELLELDPDFLVVSRPSDAYGATLAFLRAEPALAHLSCLKNGRVIELPSALYSSSSHHLLTAAEFLASAVDDLLTTDPSGE
ncbi:MAG: ABC transporter substrate-binding protein [Planctomycetota bacterium]